LEEALDKAYEWDRLEGVSVEIEHIVGASLWHSSSEIHKWRLEHDRRRVG
jgi:hypothetical protein